MHKYNRRFLKDFKEEELIHIEKRIIIIKNLKKLERIANSKH